LYVSPWFDCKEFVLVAPSIGQLPNQLAGRVFLKFRRRFGIFSSAPRNGGEAAAAMDFELERFMHLFALNRGILLTPFHNMALMSLATSEADIDRHTSVFIEAIRELTQ
jgi:glutamate-1-semialdehyde aminotransferase